jgi:hypothetical protein
MILQARSSRPSIKMNGVDFFEKLSPYFIDLSYTDHCDGEKADDLELRLADRDRRFISDWMPDKGAFVDIAIIAERWFSPNAASLSLDCGRFWIDEIEFELPSHTVSIKGTSLPTDAHIKASNETRGWDNTTLKDIANQIAGENKMSVDWQSDYNPKYSRVEQTEQSGLEFLMHRAKEAKLAIKAHRGQIVFFDEETLEAKPAQFSVVFGDIAPPSGVPCYRIGGGNFTTKLIDTTKKATVSHVDPASGKATGESYEAQDSDAVDDWHTNFNQSTDSGDEEDQGGDDGGGGGDLLVVGGALGRRSITPRTVADPVGDWNQSGPSESAQRLAKSKVRDANKDKEHGSIELSLGNPLVAAGMVMNLVGLGKYDGNWFVYAAEHKLGPTFSTTLLVRRCLKGY